MKMVDDVHDFSRKFGLESAQFPTLLDNDMFEFRYKFLQEELSEMLDAQKSGDLSGVADALIDLVYVAIGTSYLMGLPWEELWNEVHSANMKKQRATSSVQSKRNTSFDVIKPIDWKSPDIDGVLSKYK